MKAKRFIFTSTLACLLSLGAWADATDIEINEKNFPDENFRRYLTSSLGSYGYDGKFTSKEIANIMQINVSGIGVKSLQGIEHFTALTYLFCSNNQLTSLDLSKNTDLVRLDCDNNQLTALDLSKNTKLTVVNCYGNQINVLGMEDLVAGLPSVTGGKIYVIDTSNGAEQNFCANYQVKAANGKGWTVYDNHGNSPQVYAGSEPGIVINATNFPDSQFRSYLLKRDFGKDGQLTSSEITAVKEISVPESSIASLKGIEFFTALTSLDCANNKLTALDVSKNTALTALYCSDNMLTALDVSKNTALIGLFCSGNMLKALDVSQNAALTALNCSNNKLTALDVSKNAALTTLKCYCNYISGTKMDALIASMPTVQSGDFYVFYNQDDVGAPDPFGDDPSISRSVSQHYGYEGKETPSGKGLPIDHNQISKSQAYDAAVKGWTVWIHDYVFSYMEAGYWTWIVYDVSIPINEKYFPDENFRAWLLSQDYGSDGKLTPAEIVAVKSIDVHNKGIASLKGIEIFSELDFLQVSYNKLTTLDVSQNTKLQILYCIDNQLTELDVSKNTILRALNCSRNQLTTLDFSNNPYLYMLYCEGNMITEMQMETLIASLPTMEPANGQLYVGDSDSAPEQNVCTARQVLAANSKGWKVYYRDNKKWDEYGGSGSDIAIIEKNFPDANFRAWLVNNGYGADYLLTEGEIATVKEINIFSMHIASLKGIEFFTALTELYCQTNQLTALDVSKNTKLTKLLCMGNQLATLELPKGTSLKDLNCHSNQLTKLDVSQSTGLTSLSCGNNPLGTLDVSKNTALTHLWCNDSQLTTLDVSNNSELSFLNCSGNQLTALDVTKNPKLKSIDCSENRIRGKKMDVLVNSMPAVESGTFIVFCQPSDQNICTKSQVKVAKDKGWTVYHLFPEFGEIMEYSGSADILLGDANGDNNVDIVDVTSTIDHILGRSLSSFNAKAADINGDNKVDIVDVTSIIDLILGK